MADASIIKIDNTSINLKDSTARTTANTAATNASSALTAVGTVKLRYHDFSFTTSSKTVAINIGKTGYAPIGVDLPVGYAYPTWTFSGSYLYLYYPLSGSEVSGTARVYYVSTGTLVNI